MLVSIYKKGNSCALLVGRLIDIATVENSMEIPWKLKIELPSVQFSHSVVSDSLLPHGLLYNLAISLLSIYLKERTSVIWKDTCTPVCIA